MKKLLIPAFLLGLVVFSAFTLTAPAIKFDKMEHDFGTIPQGTPVTCDFTFTNTGDATLFLTEVKASCGCTTPKWPQEPIMPGKTGVITAEYNAAADGTFDKTISVFTNINGDVITLRLRGTVEKTSKVIFEEGKELKLGK